MTKQALVLNLFGGPGAGKSTTMAGVFSLLKLQGLNVEMATEYAKDLVWGRNFHSMNNQIHVFGEQHHRIWRLLDQVEVVITDSPLLLSLHYGSRYSDSFKALVREEHMKHRSLNVILERVKPYNPSGRRQSEESAKGVDRSLHELLAGFDTVTIPGDENAPQRIVEHVRALL